MTPDEQWSKNARQFYFKSGEIKRHLKELRKHVKKNYISRFSYLTNIITHEIIGSNTDTTVPPFKQKLVDRSNANKALAAVRDWFLDKGQDQKYKHVNPKLRRASLYAFSSTIDHIVAMMTGKPDARN